LVLSNRAVQARIDSQRSTRSLAKRRDVYAVVLLLIVVVVASGQTADYRVKIDPNKGNRYSIEEEIQVGQQGSAEVDKTMPLLPLDHPVTKYIQKLGQQLTSFAPGYKYPYKFRVVREKEINAFAMPGGPIYVNLGLIQAANESELAGVMGHEVSHVAMRHSTRQASKQMKAQLPLAILSGALGVGVGGWVASLAQMGISFTAGSVFMKYSRDSEKEADLVGSQIMYDAGYNPQGMVTFFNKLKAQGESSGPSMFASHPDPGNRAQTVATFIAKFPPKTYVAQDSAEFQQIKEMALDSATMSAKEVESSVAKETAARLPASALAATGALVRYEHTVFSIMRPPNWQVLPGPSSVTIAPSGGTVGTALAYGVMISGMRLANDKVSLEDGSRQLLANIMQADPQMKVTHSARKVTVGGKTAIVVDLAGVSPIVDSSEKPLAETVRMYSLPGRKAELLYLACVSTQVDVETMQPIFDQMLASFRVK
jgi:beta-barrel assembly-enhancing protease